MIQLNGKIVTFGMFPNKETNLPLDQFDMLPKFNTVKWDYEDDRDVFKLALLSSHLISLGCKADITITYMPYSRMDRPNGDYAVSLACMARLVNDMKFINVVIREPHSPVTMKLVDNSVSDGWCQSKISTVFKLCQATSILYPDGGSIARYGDTFCESIPYAIGKKTRNFNTGKITGFELVGDVTKSVLIVDDLCSRGGTFIKSAIKLREQGAINVFLMVAHCEKNVFSGMVFDYIDHLYTSTEMLGSREHPRITKL